MRSSSSSWGHGQHQPGTKMAETWTLCAWHGQAPHCAHPLHLCASQTAFMHAAREQVHMHRFTRRLKLSVTQVAHSAASQQLCSQEHA